MAKTKTAIHRSNRDANVAAMGRFLAWAENHPKEAWEQAVEEEKSKPWMLRALRSRGGEKVRELIRSILLEDLMKAEAEKAKAEKPLSSEGYPLPTLRTAQLALKSARDRYSEVEKRLRPRSHR